MRFLKLTISYDGSRYAGWQIQPNALTIQQTLETAWQKITQEKIRLTSSGRTDAGVHALAQIVGLKTESKLQCDVLCRALNTILPNDIAVHTVTKAPEGFHPIRDAIGKRYRYQIVDGPVPEVFARQYAWQVFQKIDDQAMHEAAQALLGKHDFTSFEATGSDRVTSIRTIHDIFVKRQTDAGGERIVFEVAGDGFLYNMVRIIVGTLVEIGRGRRDSASLLEIISAQDRKQAGITAPPQGLFLVSVDYNEMETK